jgi:putative ABC transport system ATP-binding protein
MKNAISLKQVQFAYEKTPVLDIEQLEIEANTSVFIHGPSGSGKTTLLNLLTGVLLVDQGQLSVNGFEYKNFSQGKRDKYRGKNIGYIFQQFNLIDYLSVRENILLPLKLNKIEKKKNPTDQLKRLAQVLKIDQFLESMPSHLSIGQQQRVAVARALMIEPELIIADEPTSSLDDEVTEDFMDLLMELKKEHQFTLIFVSHDKRLERYFDSSLRLDELNRVKN